LYKFLLEKKDVLLKLSLMPALQQKTEQDALALLLMISFLQHTNCCQADFKGFS